VCGTRIARPVLLALVRTAARLLGLVIVLAQVACIPIPCRCISPALTGRVISAEDDRPIAGAVVSEAGSKPRRAVTGDDGTFVLPEKNVWLVLVFPGEPWYLIRIRVSVSADGYKTSEILINSVEGEITNRRPRGPREPIKMEPAGS
jgi:hypothetical protein